jgi:aspartate kinase
VRPIELDHIHVNDKVAIVAVVGDNMRGTTGVAGRVFGRLGRESVNIIAIAQGSSENNISFLVDEHAVQRAVSCIHNEFHLEKGIRAGAPQSVPVGAPVAANAPAVPAVAAAERGGPQREAKR